MAVVTSNGIYNFLIPVTHPDYLNGKVQHISVGKTVVQDTHGNRFKVNVNDLRFLSGELVSINKGNTPPNHKGKIWVTNNSVNKLIQIAELNTYINLGYNKGKTQKYPSRDYSKTKIHKK